LACSVILTVTGCGLAGWSLALHHDALRVDRDLAATRHDLARLRTAAADAGALARASQDIQERIDALVQLRASQRAPVRVLDEIGRALPGDCWLTALIDDGPGRIRLDGRAPALAALFELVERLEVAGLFRSVDVLDSRATPDDSGPDLVAFSLVASLRDPRTGAGADGPGVRRPPHAVADGRSAIKGSR